MTRPPRARRPHAVGVCSGAMAIEIALRSLGIGPGDEVLIPAFGFSSMLNSVLHLGATPRFVDVDPLSLNMDPAKAAQAVGPGGVQEEEDDRGTGQRGGGG